MRSRLSGVPRPAAERGRRNLRGCRVGERLAGLCWADRGGHHRWRQLRICWRTLTFANRPCGRRQYAGSVLFPGASSRCGRTVAADGRLVFDQQTGDIGMLTVEGGCVTRGDAARLRSWRIHPGGVPGRPVATAGPVRRDRNKSNLTCGRFRTLATASGSCPPTSSRRDPRVWSPNGRALNLSQRKQRHDGAAHRDGAHLQPTNAPAAVRKAQPTQCGGAGRQYDSDPWVDGDRFLLHVR